MSVSDKIREMLNSKNMNIKDLAVYLDISVQAVRNKFTRESFNAKDLILIAESAGYELSFIPPAYMGYDDLKFTLSLEDLDEEEILKFLKNQKKAEEEKVNKLKQHLEMLSPTELEDFKNGLEDMMKQIKNKHDNQD